MSHDVCRQGRPSMAVGACRGSLSLAVAAIVAACPLWQVALALSTGDILFVNDPNYDINDRFLGRLAITVRLWLDHGSPVHTDAAAGRMQPDMMQECEWGRLVAVA